MPNFGAPTHFKALSNSQFKPNQIISEVSISWLEIFRYCKRSFLFFNANVRPLGKMSAEDQTKSCFHDCFFFPSALIE